MARFEVVGLESDRALIRSLARRLAEKGPEAGALRSAVRQVAVSAAPAKGGILAALRRSPLVGADLEIEREATAGRRLDL
ncbi:MAG: hypothetical protein QOJ53_1435 [Sphingomonadales bacterium]|jgi:hypothetical protein|nr:hypothetical protein [Sphingomonadales bacterium]